VKFVHTVIRYRGNGRATVFLEGEIDRTTVPAVGAALTACLANRMTEIDVDLAAVGFCDASGLNVFLEVSAPGRLGGRATAAPSSPGRESAPGPHGHRIPPGRGEIGR
jgi:anti-anti-sigma regulatory factor